jgi:YVTN family beta-propeller protein
LVGEGTGGPPSLDTGIIHRPARTSFASRRNTRACPPAPLRPRACRARHGPAHRGLPGARAAAALPGVPGRGRGIYVFDHDGGHKLVRKIDLPLKGARGVCSSAAAGRLWISHGDTSVLCLDLKTDKVLWEKTYPRQDGCDRLCCTPDGKKVYVPSGPWSGSPQWKALDGPSGRELGRFRPHRSGGGHNAAVSLDGSRLYCASKANDFLAVVDTATDQVVVEVGPVGGGIHPFTVNAAGTRCFLNTGRAGVGFEVGDLRTGKILQRAKVPGLEGQKRPCHGIGLSPDEKEVWLNDQGQVHLFDVTGAAPGSSKR